jgi:hypothetical protein
MAKISETELQRRLRNAKTTSGSTGGRTAVQKDGVWEYTSPVIYLAYADNITNRSTTGKIPSQADATGFQLDPYDAGGELLDWRGHLFSTSIYESGDPTDYTWELADYTGLTTSFVRFYTTTPTLLTDVGDPTFPGTGVTWTSIAGSATLPDNAYFVAEKYTIKGSTSAWKVYAVAVEENGFGLIPYTITGRDAPALNSAQWNTDTLAAVTSFTGRTYSTIKEFGYGTTIVITYDDGKLYGLLKKVSGTASFVAPVDYIDGALLVDTSIIADKIANNAITVNKILNDSINADKIADNAVTTAAIIANAITSDEIATNAVTADAILANSVTASEIAANTIIAGNIATNAITADAILAGSVGANEIAANSITAGEIAANAITASEIAANAVEAVKINAGAITTIKIAANAITSGTIAANAIIADKIATNAITSGKLLITGTGAITPSTIGAGSQADLTAAALVATNAASAALAAQGDLDDIADDEKISPAEKLQALLLWGTIQVEYTGIVASAANAGVSSTAYANKFVQLSGYIQTTIAVFSNMATSTTVTRATWDTRWKDYYTGKQALLDTIAAGLKTSITTAQTAADLAVLPSEVAAAVNTNSTTIDGGKITAASIGASHLVVSGENAVELDGLKTFREGPTPTAENLGDLWYNSSSFNKLSRWDGSSWVANQDNTVAENIYTSGTTYIHGGIITADSVTGLTINAGSIDAGHISANAVTVDKMDVDGKLTISDATGSFAFKKTGYSDYATNGVFLGNRTGSNIPVFLAGNGQSYIQVDDGGVVIVGADFADSTTITTPALPDQPTEYSVGGVYYFPISSAYATLTFKLSGAGGGGAGARSGGSGEGPGSAGGTTTIQIFNADESSTIATYTVSGGGGGGTGQGSPTGGSFSVSPSDSFFSGTGGTGNSNPGTNDAYNGTNATGQSSGGGGGSHDSWTNSDDVGHGGYVGSYSAPTAYTVTNSTYFVKITVGTGGAGGPGFGLGGRGSDGAVRISVTLV